jgi:hypothetical protein
MQTSVCLQQFAARVQAQRTASLETAMAHTIATISATVELCSEKLSDN